MLYITMLLDLNIHNSWLNDITVPTINKLQPIHLIVFYSLHDTSFEHGYSC